MASASEIRKRRSAAIERATHIRWSSPPESSRASECSRPDKPTSVNARSESSWDSACENPAARDPRATLSKTVRLGKELLCCSTQPMAPGLSCDILVTSCPSILTDPESALSSRPHTESSVVLPDPDGPSTATVSPACTSSDAPDSTCRPPNDMWRSVDSRSTRHPAAQLEDSRQPVRTLGSFQSPSRPGCRCCSQLRQSEPRYGRVTLQ